MSYGYSVEKMLENKGLKKIQQKILKPEDKYISDEAEHSMSVHALY